MLVLVKYVKCKSYCICNVLKNLLKRKLDTNGDINCVLTSIWSIMIGKNALEVGNNYLLLFKVCGLSAYCETAIVYFKILYVCAFLLSVLYP